DYYCLILHNNAWVF
nr:immunoglobulin light chain junction region [Macaca mulatta]